MAVGGPVTAGSLHELPDLSLRAAALSYAKAGWFVFPLWGLRADGRCACGRVCGRQGKHPITLHGHKDAQVGEDQVSAWWSEYPEANIGVACGESRLLVVDVDPRNNGDETFAELEATHGELPTTLTALTGGGGQHYYFDAAACDSRLRGRLLGQGVELKGSGGYVVAPPSRHISGQRYAWDAGQGTVPALPPPWLTDSERARRRFQESGAPLDGILGTAFSAAGMLGHAIGPDRAAVLCPWRKTHTQGSDYDTSTVIFGPSGRSNWGWFHCSHEHCKNHLAGLTGIQKMHEVLRALPVEATKFAAENIRGAQRELKRLTREEWEKSLAWREGKSEKLEPSAGNLQLFIENLPEWAGTLAYDESKDRLFWTRRPPELTGMVRPEIGSAIGDYDWIYVSHWFALHRGFVVRKETACDVIINVGQKNAHNSLSDYLSTLAWDGKRRLDTWLIDYAEAEDNAYVRRIGRAWLISAIARALDPGCQVDHVLVLEGRQGSGKTSLFRVLGGEWYLGNLPRLEDKDSRHVLGSAWIVEIQELAALRGVGFDRVKAYLSEKHDVYRPPYARGFARKPRRCVFGASVNPDGGFVNDSTGARRFWPVRTGQVDVDKLHAERGLLLSEALDAFRDGELWYLDGKLSRDAAAIEIAQREQEERMVVDPWQDPIAAFVEHSEEVSIGELFNVISLPTDRRSHREAQRVGSIMRALGWRRLQRRGFAGKQYVYVRDAPGPFVK